MHLNMFVCIYLTDKNGDILYILLQSLIFFLYKIYFRNDITFRIKLSHFEVQNKKTICGFVWKPNCKEIIIF